MATTNAQAQETDLSTLVITASELLNHWQGHRRVTRRVIEAFPEDKLFMYSIGGMRPFSELVMEMIHIAGPGVKGVATGEWNSFGEGDEFSKTTPQTKAELLVLWDKVTAIIDSVWPQIPLHRFHEVEAAFGQYEDSLYSSVLYFIDNEIHHRGQGYVYLRSLGITPPAFYDRS